MKSMRAWIWVVALMAMGLGGCTGYRLGTTLPPNLQSVFVPTFTNTSAEPQVEIPATSDTVNEFMRDGTMTVSDARNASTTVHGSIIKYELVPVRYDRDDAKATEEYRMIITATIRFVQNDTGKVLMETTVKGDTTFPVGGDLPSAKRAALPDASRSLARKVVGAVITYW